MDEYIVAMAKTDKPEVRQILSSSEKTEKGVLFFKKLKQKYGVTEKQLEEAAEKVRQRTFIFDSNLLILGVETTKNGNRFVFMPLPDTY